MIKLISMFMAFMAFALGTCMAQLSYQDWNSLPLIAIPDKVTSSTDVVLTIIEKDARQLVREKKYDDAMKEYEAMKEKYTSYPLVVAMAEGGIGNCLLQKNNIEELIDWTQAIHKKYKGCDPDLVIEGWPLAYSLTVMDIYLAEALEKNGRRKEALEYYERGLSNEEAIVGNIKKWTEEKKQKLSQEFMQKIVIEREMKKEAEKPMKILKNALMKDNNPKASGTVK